MTITHHPDEELIAAYATGSLDMGQHVAVATHLSTCPECRAFVRSLERVGGVMIADSEPAALTDVALDRALAALDAGQARQSPAPTVTVRTDDAPERLPRFVRAYEFGRWRAIAPKIAMRPIHLPEPSPTRVFLLKAAAGTKLIEHAHTGFEMTCVLSGAFTHAGGSYGPGDFDYGDGSVHHEPIIEGGEDCVTLVAMQGELRWQGWLGRMIQPFVRI